jgi:hypothetical protein
MYKIIGSDQKIYGPVTLALLRQWMAEGRVNAGTLVQADGATDWRPLSTYPELATPPPLAYPAPVALPPRAVAEEGSGTAAAGLICGVLALCCCCFGKLLGAAGIILSSVALAKSSADPLHRGRGMAIAGLVLSILALLLHSLSFLSLFLLPMGHHHWRTF